MRKRLLTILLALCMAVTLLPVQTLALDVSADSGLGTMGIRQISGKKYAVTPDVTEYEWVLNNDALTQQMMGHVMEVKVGKSSTASIAVGYGDDNIEAIASGNNWKMVETTKQAGSMQTRRGTNVVGAINAGGYDMSNGRPVGALIMSGTVINKPSYTTFWIDKSGNAHITGADECNKAYEEGNVLEAVASFGDIFENGHARAGLDNSTRASRTAIGIKADGTVVMLMVDGRQAPYSVGMTMAEVAAAMESLGCVQAINLDGGGSSTFATQREGEPENNDTAGLTLRCRPSDGYERKVSNTIMVLSTATATGEFDHAVVTPNDEVYTPGSKVQFTASGVDSTGSSADIPAGASWEVLSGGGSIDAKGLYTAADTTGEVTVGLKAGGKTVGQTSIQVQWPDKLAFTNNSVSVDFGETSDLTFKPTWQGRVVNYKDGDFAWTLDETKPISYKYNALVETRGWNNGWKDRNIYMSLTGAIGVQQKLEWGLYETRTYYSYFTEASRTINIENGLIQVTETLTHDKAEKLNGNAAGECSADELAERVNLSHEFTLGRFAGNSFTADSDNSLRATAKVSLPNNPAVTGEIDLVVGLEPLILMDFENGEGQNWDTVVTNRANGTSGQLTAEQVAQYGMWVRTATSAQVDFDGSGVVNAAEDDRVRFGENAFKLCFDFTPMQNASAQAAADAGFSCDLYVNTVQPTKIGMWVNVPADLKDCPYLLKAIVAGGVTDENGNASLAGYNRLNADGTRTFVSGNTMPRGTTMYTQYYGKGTDAQGNEVVLTTLGDMAGKGWIWVEADISSIQMPIDIYRAYTFRVVKTATVSTLFKGNILVDNVQFIYGTNTNDTTRPVLESVTETSSNTVLAGDGSTVLGNGSLTFAAVYSDSELTDKYATGIDQSGIRVLLDGTDYTNDTAKVEINDGSLYLKGVELRNGTHTLTIQLKDFYGNVTTEKYTFRVEDTEGMQSAIDVLPQPEAPEVGKDYVLSVVNNTGEAVVSAEVTVDFSAMGDAAKYLTGASVESTDDYELTLDQDALAKGLVKITIQKKAAPQSLFARLFGARSTISYDYVSELGYLTIKIPEDAAQGSALKYTVTQGTYTIGDGTSERSYTFSGTEQEIALTAGYQLSYEQAVVGMSTELTVTDANGDSVSRATIYQVGKEKPLGKTNLKGTLTLTFDTAGEYTLYAEKANSGRSWNQRLIVCEKTAENEGKPFGILTNGVTEANTKSITWLTQLDGAEAKAVVKYGTTNDLSETVEGTSAILTFTESVPAAALRSNQVKLTGLKPGVTYYYQVGDGENWSETRSFTMPEADDSTNFFILGDIQSTDTANLASALRTLAADETAYDFALQTGDAIDNVTKYTENWRPFLNTVNSKTLNGVDLIHVLGNHEYYSDADGKISGAIYDLPVSTQNSWYKMEYNNVCVVVVNNGTKLAEALADIADNLTTDCIWKVLVAHEPIYGTESVSATTEIVSSIEKAGFDFVFGGDDHAYARTYPMIGGVAQAEDSRGGVVYFVCGDLSGKSNEFNNRDEYVTAIPHNDYGGMYMTVEATEEHFTVKAIDINGNVLDTYTEQRTNCELGRHQVDGTSKYDVATGTVTCVVCGKPQPASNYPLSGLLETTDGKQVILTSGALKTNAFSQMLEDRYHSCADGYAYKTTQGDSRTCVTGGYITYTCPTCKAVEKSDFQRPNGHVWDEDHVCTICETKGIDIASAEVVFKMGSPDKPRDLLPVPTYYYQEGGVRPSSFAKRGDYVLTQSNDNNLTKDGKIVDLYREWPNSNQVGAATIVYTGRGDYYGTVELPYKILPNDVKGLKCETAVTEMDSLALSWTAALGAEKYKVYQCDANNSYSSRTLLTTTADTTYTVTGLTADTAYYFVVRGCTEADGETFESPYYSNILYARTLPTPVAVTGVSAAVDGQTITLAEADGAKYLFLPASADLTKLSLTFVTDAQKDRVTLSGNNGTVYLSDTVDITAVASVTNGYREITAAVGKGAETLTFRVMQASAIPTVYLTSDNAAQGRDWVDASKKNAATGSMNMVNANGESIYSGNLTQIKARGNSTFTYAEKKAYQIKLGTASDLLGNQEQVKTWVLLASYFDATQMHDKLIKDLATELGLDYTASCDWVNLYYDGEYRGVYLLSEKNSVGTTGVAITDMETAYKKLNSKYGTNMKTATATNAYGQEYQYTTNLIESANMNITGGYLIELNHDQWDEASGFKTSQGVAFNVKSPEWCSDKAMKYISEYYQEFENAVYATDETGAYTGYNAATGKYFYEYVDMDSLVKLFLLQELGLNCDGFISSVYFYKDADGLMYAGPIWDQDMIFGTGWNKTNDSSIVDYHYLAEALIRIPAFADAVKEYYTNTFASEARDLLGSNGTIAQQYARLKDNAAMNYKLWDYIRIGNPSVDGHIWQGATYQGVVDDMTSWIEARLANMDSRFNLQSTVAGDVDGDGEVDISDAVALLRYLAGYVDEGTISANGDFDGDGEVDISDVVALLRYLAGYTD